MKTDIHPDYQETAVVCSCGNSFTTRSVVSELHVELCNECHPFFTGKQKLVDSGGRVERFQKRYGKTSFASGGPTPASAPHVSAEPAEDEAEPAEDAAEPAEDTAAVEAGSSEQGPAEEEA